jgi:CRISPR type III-B/RAMP module RAMP protein Cmr6
MAIFLPPETRNALGDGLLLRCNSRTLFKDRFADPAATDRTDPTRKAWFDSMIARKAEHRPQATWLPAHAAQLYARLMSRLMVNMAGGVMENANVQLDRYGLPVIPGSVVKGCARRMALQALHDWVQAQADHPTPDATPDDACAPCGEGFSNPAEMLAAIARIFGWTPEDWKTDKKDGHYKSDFAWATGGNQDLLQDAKSRNPAFDIFGGTIAFLSASPNRDPGLELDVVTPHHTKYYQGELSAATDTEEPVPVFFPAVKPQGENDYFTFPLIPLRLAQPGDLDIAKRWLAHGLQLLGLGAKTNAGYGWFDTSDTFQTDIQKIIAAEQKAQAERQQRAAEEARRKQAEEEARQKKQQLAAATAGMTEEQKADYLISQLTDEKFEFKVKNFFKQPKHGGPSESEKPALIRALRGPRLAFWQEFKVKASKGGDLARAKQAIDAFNKQLNKDKMP